jgi:hypothetical protein
MTTGLVYTVGEGTKVVTMRGWCVQVGSGIEVGSGVGLERRSFEWRMWAIKSVDKEDAQSIN